jgi:hypothetical protein
MWLQDNMSSKYWNNTCYNINTHFFFDVFYAVINFKIVNIYKSWSNMKMLMLFHDFDVIGSVIT